MRLPNVGHGGGQLHPGHGSRAESGSWRPLHRHSRFRRIALQRYRRECHGQLRVLRRQGGIGAVNNPTTASTFTRTKKITQLLISKL
jgi:hypothetical protein